MKEIFFHDWASLRNVAVTTLLAFVILFLFVRISGKRTLAQLNAFDFVVTIALGSTMAYMMLGLVPLAEGGEVLLLLIVLQYLFAWTARSSRGVEKIINSVPQLLYYDGRFITDGLAKEAVTKEEILAAIRASGLQYMSDVQAVVMEINGDLTVVKKSEGTGATSLEGIEK
ncbi:MAG: DUF421 domain-containing protein [Flavobacterium sp.]|nr:MAG: DUF421 domain-containing protein [Flavobacterium sp.]